MPASRPLNVAETQTLPLPTITDVDALARHASCGGAGKVLPADAQSAALQDTTNIAQPSTLHEAAPAAGRSALLQRDKQQQRALLAMHQDVQLLQQQLQRHQEVRLDFDGCVSHASRKPQPAGAHVIITARSGCAQLTAACRATHVKRLQHMTRLQRRCVPMRSRTSGTLRWMTIVLCMHKHRHMHWIAC